MSERRKRKYQPVWEKIKCEGSARLEVAPSFVARLKKAVIKEKDMDIPFKLMNDHDVFRLEIVYDREKRILRFRLLQKFGLEERVVTI